jgi:hypothetical protein
MNNYEGIYFNFELVTEGDDVYPENTLLFYIKESKNLLSTIYISKNEMDLATWNNQEFKQFIDSMLTNMECTFDCAVKDDNKKIYPIKFSYKNNILKIPMHEGKYHIDTIELKIDSLICEELMILHKIIK